MAQRLGVVLAVLNALLFLMLLGNQVRPAAGDSGVLRGRGLEIVDDQGRVRASISVHGPENVDGVDYPETVLFRMNDPQSGPVVKMTAAANGAALGLWKEADGGGVQLYAQDNKGCFVKVMDKGRKKILQP